MTTTPSRSAEAGAAARRPTGKNVRWGIAVLIGIGVLINYFDRSNLSVAQGTLSDDVGLSASQVGILLSSFGWSYLLFQIPMGILVDRIGVKWMQRLAAGVWFVATGLTALASGMGLILVARLILGAAEAPSLVAASKAVGYWFPVRERGTASATYEVAAKLSNVIAIPLIAVVVERWGWQAAFTVTAVLSLLFAIAFWIWYRDPQEKASLSTAEYDYIRAGGAQQPSGEQSLGVTGLRQFLTERKIWGLSIGFAAYNYSFYLFLTWIPGYLEKEMGMGVLESGAYAVVPWIVATITDLLIAGWLVDHLIKKGRDATKVRKTVLVVSMVFGLAVVGAAFSHTPGVAVLWITIALGGLAAVSPVCWSIPSLIAPTGAVGTVSSIMNCIGQVGAIVAPMITGFTVDATGSFAPAFIAAGVVLVVGIISFAYVLGSLDQIKLPSQPTPATEAVPDGRG
ncbi:MFS transporter [Streptomyces sp. NPDC102340]|uniref:MFS transporter n=1 Tax=unclassified Streptomyces TaxID=2593676 RepID=UPI003825753B